MERYQSLQLYLRAQATLEETCARCQLGERQVYRLLAKVKKAEQKGRSPALAIAHASQGRISNRARPEAVKAQIKKIIAKSYPDFGPTLAAEKLEQRHQIKISKEALRVLLTEWGLWQPKPRKAARHRAWRERKALFGQLIQFDGSYHRWFEDRAKQCCLLAGIDDATGQILGLRFVTWEGVFPSFSFWRAYLQAHGKPIAIYLDRHSTYKINTKTLLDDPEARSQFQRAMAELDIDVIHAYSPEAKGRVERLFATLQDRLVKELRLAGIATKEAANEFVAKTFIPEFNQRFAVAPASSGDAHRPLVKTLAELDAIFTIQTSRVVMNDFTLIYKGRYFQLLPTTLRLTRPKDKVQVCEDSAGQIHISLRGATLPFTELPRRPKKSTSTKKAVKTKYQWKPGADHPWKQSYNLPKQKVDSKSNY